MDYGSKGPCPCSLSRGCAPLNYSYRSIRASIELNKLLGLEFLIGAVKLKAHDLCRPCKSLQKNFNQTNTIKELLKKGGLRCEILTNGTICKGDIIKIFK